VVRPSNYSAHRAPLLGGSELEVLKVSSKSNPNSCAGALAGVLRQTGAVEVQVVGAGALNQAIKAVAIARGFVEDSGLDLVCVPTFADIEIDGESRTAIRLLVEDRARRQPVTLDMRSERATIVNGDGRSSMAPLPAPPTPAPAPASTPAPSSVPAT
jgi:stage V sporulation protein S